MTDSLEYRNLGSKTFWIFVLQRSQPLFILFMLFLGLIFFGPLLITPQYSWIVHDATIGIAIIFFIYLALDLIISWLIYVNYKFALTENALRIERGILNKEEISIPYRQIQNINATRMLPDRFLGVSRLIIMTAGEEDKDDVEPVEAEGILPVLDKNLAEELLQELTRRADIQRVVNVSK